MNDKVIESRVQVAISNAILGVLVRRGLVSNNEADETISIIIQKLQNNQLEDVA